VKVIVEKQMECRLAGETEVLGENPGLVMWDFVMDKSGTGAGFLRVLWLFLPIFIPQILPQSPSSIIWG
jgi:hypothetical protein